MASGRCHIGLGMVLDGLGKVSVCPSDGLGVGEGERIFEKGSEQTLNFIEKLKLSQSNMQIHSND